MALDFSLNSRERRKLAEKFEQLAKDSNKLAEALRNEDDSTVLVQYLIVSFSGQGTLKELADIIQEEAEVRKAAKGLDEL